LQVTASGSMRKWGGARSGVVTVGPKGQKKMEDVVLVKAREKRGVGGERVSDEFGWEMRSPSRILRRLGLRFKNGQEEEDRD